MKRSTIRILFIVTLALSVLTLSGCNEQELNTLRSELTKYQGIADQANSALGKYEQQAATLDAMIAGLPVGDETRDKLITLKAVIDKNLPTVRAYATEATASVDRLQAQIADWNEAGPVELVGAGIQSVSPAIPQPWGGIGYALGTLLVGIGTFWTGSKKGKTAAVAKIVPAIEVAKKGDTLDFSDKESVDMLRAALGEEFNNLIDAARGS